jgi:hypothetical protein
MPETREIRQDLTKEELERLQKYGSLSFKAFAGPTCGSRNSSPAEPSTDARRAPLGTPIGRQRPQAGQGEVAASPRP